MTAVDLAYVYTKERILDGRFVGGLMISEGDVSADVGVSRTPVREAFLRLASEGFLELYPKRAALIVPVSASEVESVMETRLIVEQFAIGKTLSSGNELSSQLASAMADQERLAERGDARGFVEADREFHRVFIVASDNFILLQLYDSLRDRQSRMGLTALARDADRTRRIMDEHRSIVEAVNAGDCDAATGAIRHHLHEQTLVLLQQASAVPAEP